MGPLGSAYYNIFYTPMYTPIATIYTFLHKTCSYSTCGDSPRPPRTFLKLPGAPQSSPELPGAPRSF